MTNAIELTNVSKIYRRYTHRRQFATLKSALLSRSLVRDLSPDETFAAVRDLTVRIEGLAAELQSAEAALRAAVQSHPSNGATAVEVRELRQRLEDLHQLILD